MTPHRRARGGGGLIIIGATGLPVTALLTLGALSPADTNNPRRKGG